MSTREEELLGARQTALLKAMFREERERKVCARAEQGYTQVEIARGMGITRECVYAILRRHGITARSGTRGALAQLPHGAP